LGRDRFGLEMGGLNHLPSWDGKFRLEKGVGLDLDSNEELWTDPDNDCYCRRTITQEETVGIADVRDTDWTDDEVYQEFGVTSYFGTPVSSRSESYGTLWFGSSEPREKPFSAAERSFIELMGQWLSYELERREREAELEETIKRLQQSNDRLKQFAYAASHDLQEPLRMVSSYLQLLENKYKDELDEEAQKYIDFAVDGADRMRAMVNDLLSFSRVEQANSEFEQVDCNRVLDQVTDDLRVQIEENDAEVTVDSLPTVVGDGEQLEQVFCNLVSNAIRYSGDEPPQVEIAVEERTSHWEFSVADNGIGIDPDKTNRIFEVFKRLHHDDEYSGTGIGLSLCQEIVEDHGGYIWVESEPGKGSTFFFTVPKQTAD
jgi:light-regulated signal transduction histidine kinase (bacteriophytochrome)